MFNISTYVSKPDEPSGAWWRATTSAALNRAGSSGTDVTADSEDEGCLPVDEDRKPTAEDRKWSGRFEALAVLCGDSFARARS